MKRFKLKYSLILLAILFLLNACNEAIKTKSKYTEEELKVLTNNPEFLLKYKDTALVLAGFRGVKLDTTTFKNTKFEMKGWIMEYAALSPEVYDSILLAKYGIKTEKVSLIDYFKYYSYKSPDTTRRQQVSTQKYWQLNELKGKIEKKYHYKDERYDEAYWEERGITFIRVQKSWQKEPALKWPHVIKWQSISKIDYKKDEDWISSYCKNILVPDSVFDKTNCEVAANFKLNFSDTSGLHPIDIDFDTMGNIKQIQTREKLSEDKMKLLWSVFSPFNGRRKYKLMNQKYIEYNERYLYPLYQNCQSK